MKLSHGAERALLLFLTAVATAHVARAQQADAVGAVAPAPSKPEARQLPATNAAVPEAAVPEAAVPKNLPAPSPTPVAAGSTQLPTVQVNGGPSADILRSAREAGFKIKIDGGKTHFCKTEAHIGSRFASESCMNEQQLTLFLYGAQAQRDQLTSMPGTRTSFH